MGCASTALVPTESPLKARIASLARDEAELRWSHALGTRSPTDTAFASSARVDEATTCTLAISIVPLQTRKTGKSSCDPLGV